MDEVEAIDSKDKTLAMLVDESLEKDGVVNESKNMTRHLNLLEGTTHSRSWVISRLKKILNLSYHKHGEDLPDVDTFEHVYQRHQYSGIYVQKLFEKYRLIVYDESSFCTVNFSTKSWYFKGETLKRKQNRIT